MCPPPAALRPWKAPVTHRRALPLAALPGARQPPPRQLLCGPSRPWERWLVAGGDQAPAPQPSLDTARLFCFQLTLTIVRQTGGLGISIAGGKGSTPYKGDDEVRSRPHPVLPAGPAPAAHEVLEARVVGGSVVEDGQGRWSARRLFQPHLPFTGASCAVYGSNFPGLTCTLTP